MGKIRSRESKRCAACASGKTASGGITDAIGGTAEQSTIARTVSERVKTLADLIRVCDIDTVAWEIVRWECKASQMGSIPRTTGNREDGWQRPSTDPVITQLYHVSVTLKPKVAILAARDEIASMLTDAKKQIAVVPKRQLTRAGKLATTGNMLEISIPDLHVGKLAWARETGWDNYDSKIAAQCFKDALLALIARTSAYKFDRVLFVCGNDILHSDTSAGATTGGTLLDTDSRYQKSFSTVRKLMIWAIDTLREIAPVTVPMVSGNHDQLSVWHLGDSLECWYHTIADVKIDNEPCPRKYIQHGKVMLLMTHGHKGQHKDYPNVMAAEQPAMWGATTFREAHTGHIHQLKVLERYGVKVRVSPALCSPDAWHSENQFIGNGRSAEAFVWSSTHGLLGTAYYTVPETVLADEEGAA